jgi:hypothetical protein
LASQRGENIQTMKFDLVLAKPPGFQFTTYGETDDLMGICKLGACLVPPLYGSLPPSRSCALHPSPPP